jgi:hypothetical protein
MLKRTAWAGMTLAVAIGFAGAPGYAQSAKLVSEFKDWKVHHSDGTAQQICFASSQPKETQPRGISRRSAYFYVSAFPGDGVKAEISLKLGFSAQNSSSVVVQIASGRWQLFTAGDRAFVSDPRDELKLIDAMKRGSFMTVTANTSNGTEVKDTYSLLGVTNAINSIDDCG